MDQGKLGAAFKVITESVHVLASMPYGFEEYYVKSGMKQRKKNPKKQQ